MVAEGSKKKELTFGMSASGWLFAYQLGSAHAIQRLGIPQMEGFDCKFVGASGGSAVSACLALDVDAMILKDFLLQCNRNFHDNRLRNLFMMREYVKQAILRCMDSETFKHEGLTSGKLHVAVTLVPSMRGKIISQFSSNEEYLEAVLGSCTFSPFAGMPFSINRPDDPHLHGKYVMDGGIANMLPRFNDETITVTPLHFLDADVKPSRYVPLHWAVFPPSPKEMDELFFLGARDMTQFLFENAERLEMNLSTEIPKQVFLQQQMEMRKIARIKPRHKSMTVSPHSSHDDKVSALNPHSHSIPKREIQQEQQVVRIERMLVMDTIRSGAPMSSMNENMSKVKDSMFVASMAAIAKPLALSLVYAELWSKAALNVANAGVAAVENKRRQNVQATKGWFSLRRWVHDGMIGTASESWQRAKKYVKTAIDPALLVHHRIEDDHPKKKEVHDKLMDTSFVYRLIM